MTKTTGVKMKLIDLKRNKNSGLLDEWVLNHSESFREAVEKEIHKLVNSAIESQLTDTTINGPWAVLARTFDALESDALESYKPGDIHFFMNLDGDTRPVFKVNILEMVEYEIEGEESPYPDMVDQKALDRFNKIADVFEAGAKRLRSLTLYEPNAAE